MASCVTAGGELRRRIVQSYFSAIRFEKYMPMDMVTEE